MPAPAALIVDWARSPVAPLGGAFAQLSPHELAAPVLQGLLQRAGLPAEGVDAIVVGNAMGAGGNPARLLSLAAGLPERCASFSVDTQCCSGLDAVSLGVGLLASGQASVVIAGGVEAWSRAPIRMHRPLHPGVAPVAYERPAFAPDPRRDPDMLVAAARYAQQDGYSRAEQEAYAILSHQRALQQRSALREEIVPVAGVAHDLYPRALDPRRVARMPALFKAQETGLEASPATDSGDCSLSALTVSCRADGAAFVLLASAEACARWGLEARAAWVGNATTGADPGTPLVAAAIAAQQVLQRAGIASAQEIDRIELHDAFAVQGLSFCRALGLPIERINQRGGGLARGHPIGASAAIALVRLLADLRHDCAPGQLGLSAVAGAGGIGSAALLRRL
ncbi:MAG: hypothetical protein RLZZ555_295 [Pseudomonadota bacterium]|jgi:acetyl-CoA C-acetyltransferase